MLGSLWQAYGGLQFAVATLVTEETTPSLV